MEAQRRVALITGGTRGIGLGIARCLASEDCDIATCGMREEAAVQETLESLRALGADVIYCQADVSERKDREALLAAVRSRFGCLHVLVNNAGVAPEVRADILEATEDSFERVMHINLQGPYFLTQAVAKWMIEQRQTDCAFQGCIINISSMSATVASTNRGEYCVSKAGLSMATKLWAARLGEFAIPVYEVQPGIIRTDMTAGVREKYDRRIAQGLLVQPRWGLPEDVGKAVAALVRGEFSYSTGQVIMVDGGLTLQRL